jgi:hypothetical protein
MFIRTVTKSNSKGSKKYQCHQLVESIRTEKGVRQKLLLSLGRLNLPKEKWPRLVARMKAIIQNQESLFDEDNDIEALAQKYAQLFIKKHGLNSPIDRYQSVDTKSLKNQRVRHSGGEYLGTVFFKKLQLEQCLKRCGFTKRQIEIAMLLIIGLLVHPGSERHLYEWAQNISGLDELIHTDFAQLSLNSLYKVPICFMKTKQKLKRISVSKKKICFLLTKRSFCMI